MRSPRSVWLGDNLVKADHYDSFAERYSADADYFALARWSEDYTFDGHSTELTYWHRPLHAMTDAFTDAGFRVSVVSEPPMSPETPREILPPHLVGRTSFICFIFFVLEAR